MAYTSESTLISSTTVTSNATTAGSAVASDLYKRGAAILSCTAVSGGATLDVWIQTNINGTWTDIARFSQVSTVSTRVMWDIGDGQAGTVSTIEEATQDAAIAVQTKRAGPWGTQIRAKYTTASTGSITFSLTIALQA